MTEAKEFFETNVTRQREMVERFIQIAMCIGDPVVRLPFDTYPVVEAEMAAAGWVYESYKAKDTGKRCALFYPKQYEYVGEE